VTLIEQKIVEVFPSRYHAQLILVMASTATHLRYSIFPRSGRSS
jgi:hypothetical protein